MTISFVSKTTWTKASETEDTPFTVNKPASIQAGDLLLAFVSFHVGTNSERTLTLSGWTLVRSSYASNAFPHQHVVFSKVAGSSEPSSWSGSFSSGVLGGGVVTCAYRGTSSFILTGESNAGTVTSYSTATLNNPDNKNWRLVSAGYTSTSVSFNITSNETIERSVHGTDYGGNAFQVGVWDSNTTIATGNTSKTISRGTTWDSSASFIGILDADDAVASGTMAVTLPKVTATYSGSHHNDADLVVALPQLTMTAQAIGTPPDGPLDVAINPTVTMAAATAASGTLSTVVMPLVQFFTESRKFGIRVTIVEAEDRTIVPLLGSDTVEVSAMLPLFVREAAGGDKLNAVMPQLRASFH